VSPHCGAVDDNVHHWAWAFVLGYYSGPFGATVNLWRETCLVIAAGDRAGIPERLLNMIINPHADTPLGARAALMGYDVRVFGIGPDTLARLWRHNILMQWP
jgi:hypothetical protein